MPSLILTCLLLSALASLIVGAFIHAGSGGEE